MSAQSTAQSIIRPAGVVLPTSDYSDRLRLRQLAGDTASLGWTVLRSNSAVPRDSASRSPRGVLWLSPTGRLVVNTVSPFSLNDGAMWAERGLSADITGGADIKKGRFHLVIAPELWESSNADFVRIRDYKRFFSPSPGAARYGDGFADPWYVKPYSADLPWRLGKSSPIGQIWFGQSGAWYNAGPVEFGATTENLWWGPGIRNAIIMSDNAAGIPRLELRTPKPWHTRAGTFEGQWLVGALGESQYFDTDKSDNVRSLSAAMVSWRPNFQPTLTLGVTRAVFATANGYGSVPFRWLDVFANTGNPNDHPAADSSLYPGGRDQLFSLFGRWVFPEDGFEAYTEWARQELPRSLHDFVIAPSQSQGYTLGIQYRKPAPLNATTFRIQAEVTTLEQSGTFKNRPQGVFYTSRRVIQGYTEFGKPIGASFGPGSGQWFAIDRVSPSGSFGITFNRIRWNEDVRSTYNWPAYLGYCNHDVSLLPGVRGGRNLGRGYLSGELILGTRLNAFFQNQSGCTGRLSTVDLHNKTLSLSFSPFHP